MWNYASVVGMLMYLTSKSSPEIAFAAHQCVRFTHCIKHSHEQAVLQICKYSTGCLILWVSKPQLEISLNATCRVCGIIQVTQRFTACQGSNFRSNY
eukprot:1449315-Ditylum_brightwellii.AAC.1